jgi:hypothetical protein
MPKELFAGRRSSKPGHVLAAADRLAALVLVLAASNE